MKNIVRMSLVTVGLLAVMASANTIEITDTAGTGNSSAFLALNFGDGARYNFQIFFDGPATGEQLLNSLEAETSLDVIYNSYEDANHNIIQFVDGFSYDGHMNAGYAGGDNYWSYWTADSLKPNGFPDWSYSFVGCSDREVQDGSWDGWVYGRATAPYVPEPASLALMALGFMVLRNRNQKLSS